MRADPRLTEPIFVTQLRKGKLLPPSDFQHEPSYDTYIDTSIESPLNIDTKVSTNMLSVWLL